MPRLRFAFATSALACAGVAWLAVLHWSPRAGTTAQDATLTAVELGATGRRLAQLVNATVISGWQRAPAVVIGLGALVIFPAAAMFTLAVRARRRQQQEALRREALARQARQAARLVRPGGAWLDIDGPHPAQHRVRGELVRIGRDAENDLCLKDPNVHLHHALIQWTADGEFVLVDVSGTEGNGTRVNGRQARRARLTDGDLIELGNSRVRFRCELVSRMAQA